jgi:hypothetical protein
MAPERVGADASAGLRMPLLLLLWILLAFEAVTGFALFMAELIWGRRPGETLHVLGGALLAGCYAAYQWGHWRRVARLRPRADHVLGWVAAATMALTLLSGIWLGGLWCRDRWFSDSVTEVRYPPLLSAVHNVGSMLVMAFVGAHVGAVLLRHRLPSGAERQE